MSEQPSPLTRDELATVILALGTEGREFQESDAEVALQWAEGARLDSLLLDLVLDGSVDLACSHGQLLFRTTKQLGRVGDGRKKPGG